MNAFRKPTIIVPPALTARQASDLMDVFKTLGDVCAAFLNQPRFGGNEGNNAPGDVLEALSLELLDAADQLAGYLERLPSLAPMTEDDRAMALVRHFTEIGASVRELAAYAADLALPADRRKRLSFQRTDAETAAGLSGATDG